ncbi:hypothetical protein [Shewanella sp.]|uniref:hypothetical protein n=1 Tax=Shewanella sp. TaxID=50422 RepID=UPI00356519E1
MNNVHELAEIMGKETPPCANGGLCSLDITGCLSCLRNLYAKAILDDGYTKPVPISQPVEMKLISDDEIEKVWMGALKENPHWEVDAVGLFKVVAQAQLAADQQAASIQLSQERAKEKDAVREERERIIEYLRTEEKCPNNILPEKCSRIDCKECWLEALKEKGE